MRIVALLALAAASIYVVPHSSLAADPRFSNTYQVSGNDQEAEIKKIREEYNRINGLNLKAENFKYETKDCVEGGEITYYSAGGQVVKVREKGAMDDAVWSKEYYYHDGKVIFCIESLKWGAAAGPTQTTTYRFYIKDGKSIREMEDKNITELSEKAAGIITTADKLLKVKATKNFASVYCD